MKFLNQPFASMQCAQTCLAMILDMSVEDVCNEMDEHWSTSFEYDTEPYLNGKGYKTSLVKTRNLKFEDVPNHSLIRICRPDESGHVLIKYEDKYYDPAIGIIEKPIGHFKVTHYITYKKE